MERVSYTLRQNNRRARVRSTTYRGVRHCFSERQVPRFRSLIRPLPLAKYNRFAARVRRRKLADRMKHLPWLTRATIKVCSSFRVKCVVSDLRHSLTQNRRKIRPIYFVLGMFLFVYLGAKELF